MADLTITTQDDLPGPGDDRPYVMFVNQTEYGIGKFLRDDGYVLGIVTSSVHRAWIFAQKSTIKGDTRYTHTTCFNTFPFPQLLTADQAAAIRQQMIELNDYRDDWMVNQQKGITEMYNRLPK